MTPIATITTTNDESLEYQNNRASLDDRSGSAESGRRLVESTLIRHASCIDPSTCEPGEEDAFFVVDMGEVFRQHKRWKLNLKRVKAHYAIKCNPDPEVIRLLAALGHGFDCASKVEIDQVLEMGIDPSRIIFAHTCKPRSSIRYAKKAGVKQMTFDSADELLKIQQIFPDAELYLRIVTDDSSSVWPLSIKFGAPLSETEELLRYARDLNLKVVGVSFHVGSGATKPDIFVKAIEDARTVFNQARVIGYNLHTLDIGGGFGTSSMFEKMAEAIRGALEVHFPSSVRVIGEPGRYFVQDAYTLACNVIARRRVTNSKRKPSYMLYLNDGIYGNFMGNWLEHTPMVPRILSARHSQEDSPVECSIWGPTCDGIDRIIERIVLPYAPDIGDWLYFQNLGAYSNCLTTRFNGFSVDHEVIYVCSETEASLILEY